MVIKYKSTEAIVQIEVTAVESRLRPALRESGTLRSSDRKLLMGVVTGGVLAFFRACATWSHIAQSVDWVFWETVDQALLGCQQFFQGLNLPFKPGRVVS